MRLVRNGPELEQGPVQAHRGEAEGPVVGGLPALFFCRPAPVSWAPDTKGPAIGGAFCVVGADIRQGRNRGDPDVPGGYRHRAECDATCRFWHFVTVTVTARLE